MDVTESDLPGVGKKHEVDIGGGQQLVVVTHNTGTRELFLRENENADSEKLFELSDRMARMVGTILEGAYFQPVESDHVETMLSEGTLLEWYAVEEDSPLVGETPESVDIGQRTGVTVVAIQRDDDVIAGSTSTAEIEAGDTIVVIGERDNCERFEKLLAGEL
ncbi:cation:proton antiporter regulatory subunit [Haloarcula amylolytica]|uniref:TrkA-C domain-containing protein n=1 Tax=Haloarcula amylolytica JCM 13557 TaxID=1227452 RepID=M0KHH6_9EURY|nr:TrkA C-terminal domain-containing protein [Haloarcula amylolytica]EMA19604.1 TrkA-C domain-containing protein [Haloarcula amylolytica JCM 13557]